jgi:hypothetical protein
MLAVLCQSAFLTAPLCYTYLTSRHSEIRVRGRPRRALYDISVSTTKTDSAIRTLHVFRGGIEMCVAEERLGLDQAAHITLSVVGLLTASDGLLRGLF